MRTIQMIDDSRLNSTQPYHGSQETYARLFFWLAMLMGAMVLALPWLDVRLFAHDVQRGHLIGLALSINVLCVTAIATFVQVYRGLGQRIAQGGPSASYLDGLRLRIATGVNSLLFAGVVLHMCGAWANR